MNRFNRFLKVSLACISILSSVPAFSQSTMPQKTKLFISGTDGTGRGAYFVYVTRLL